MAMEVSHLATLGGGTKSIHGLGINRMEGLVTFTNLTWSQIGEDMLLTAYIK